MKRRLALLLGAALVAGFLLNLAIAAWCALRLDGMPFPSDGPAAEGASHADAPRWSVAIYTTFGSTVIPRSVLREGAPAQPPPLRPDATQEQVNAWLEAQARFQAGLPPLAADTSAPRVVRVPGWSGATRRPEPDADPGRIIEDARGWPFRTLVSYHLPEGDPRRRWHIRLDGDQGPLQLPLVLPLRPLWGGLVLNTLALAVIPAALVATLLAMRSRRRARQGRCVACGHLLADATRCPECGAPRRSR